MKKTACLAAGIALALGLLGAGTFVRSATKGDRSDEINRLQKERFDALHQVVEMVEVTYRNGRTSYDSLVQASSQLLNAELDLAKDHDARLAVLQRQVELLESWEKVAQARYEAAEDSQAAVLTAHAATLEGRIRLLREQDEGH